MSVNELGAFDLAATDDEILPEDEIGNEYDQLCEAQRAAEEYESEYELKQAKGGVQVSTRDRLPGVGERANWLADDKLVFRGMMTSEGVVVDERGICHYPGTFEYWEPLTGQ